jgi:hypothetical protein
MATTALSPALALLRPSPIVSGIGDTASIDVIEVPLVR